MKRRETPPPVSHVVDGLAGVSSAAAVIAGRQSISSARKSVANARRTCIYTRMYTSVLYVRRVRLTRSNYCSFKVARVSPLSSRRRRLDESVRFRRKSNAEFIIPPNENRTQRKRDKPHAGAQWFSEFFSATNPRAAVLPVNNSSNLGSPTLSSTCFRFSETG